MTISGISNATQIQPNAAAAQSNWQTRMQQMLAPVAQLFGMTTSQLEQSIQSGQSLSDIATSKGVSQPDLLNTIKAGLQQDQPSGAPSLSDTQLTNLANGVANRHHHHHGRGGEHCEPSGDPCLDHVVDQRACGRGAGSPAAAARPWHCPFDRQLRPRRGDRHRYERRDPGNSVGWDNRPTALAPTHDTRRLRRCGTCQAGQDSGTLRAAEAASARCCLWTRAFDGGGSGI